MHVIQGKNYISYFNDVTGEYLRTGILENGVDTGVDPFMAEFPELLDVGIMGHCTHGKLGLCAKAGVECYQNGRTANAPNMSVQDFEKIVKECKNKTFQIALGGCGDPDQHDYFEEILRICRENNIVPNFTTSGLGMNEEKAALCKKYCGAVAVSWYRSQYTLDAIDCLLRNGVKTNIHYVLNKDTIAEAVERLKAGETTDGFPQGINAVIFLLHKPIGQGSREKMITVGNTEFDDLMKYIDSNKLPYKVGFDSCTVPALLSLEHMDYTCLDTCEGGRWSAYISADMKMMPCSFAHEMSRYSVSLKENSVMAVWRSKEFDAFRKILMNACPDCEKRELCMGGCPILPEIVLCKEKKNGS